jgi:hypothetical protein
MKFQRTKNQTTRQGIREKYQRKENKKEENIPPMMDKNCIKMRT